MLRLSLSIRTTRTLWTSLLRVLTCGQSYLALRPNHALTSNKWLVTSYPLSQQPMPLLLVFASCSHLKYYAAITQAQRRSVDTHSSSECVAHLYQRHLMQSHPYHKLAIELASRMCTTANSTRSSCHRSQLNVCYHLTG